jgi:hypothetical protein
MRSCTTRLALRLRVYNECLTPLQLIRGDDYKCQKERRENRQRNQLVTQHRKTHGIKAIAWIQKEIRMLIGCRNNSCNGTKDKRQFHLHVPH